MEKVFGFVLRDLSTLRSRLLRRTVVLFVVIKISHRKGEEIFTG
jgi:hypothetical protein